MDLQELKKNWECFGQTDPLWAVLTHPGKRGNKWSVEEFFRTGLEEIVGVLNSVLALQSAGESPRFGEYTVARAGDQNVIVRKARALDFGCGVGRLTQALALFFEECHGVDIASSMIELARKYNRHGDRCIYHVNDRADLELFGSDSFDFIYSNLVLQHMEPTLSLGYVREFIRVLAPGGVLVFYIPSEAADSSGPESGEGRPLPDQAFSAEIIPELETITVPNGSSVEIPVRVRNTSGWTWPGPRDNTGYYPLNLGNHWLDSAGRPLAWDNARMPLPKDLPPGEEVNMLLAVAVDREPGDYLLELDLVQEQVAWFAEKDSKPARIRVRVRGKPRSDFQPVMQMYAVPLEEVLPVLDASGALTIHIEESSFAGPGWRGFRYFVTK